MEEVPKITVSQIMDTEEEIKQRIEQGTVTNWLSEKLQELSSSNPILYKYIIERSQKFAVGATMVQDVKTIAISMALEHLTLLELLGKASKDSAEFKKFSDLMGGWFNSGIEGLDKLDE